MSLFYHVLMYSNVHILRILHILEEYYVNGPSMKTDFSLKRRSSELIDKKGSELICKKEKESFGFNKEEETRLFSHALSKPKSSIPQNYVPKLNTGTDKSYLKRRSEDLDELIPKREGHAKLVEDRRIKSAHTRVDRNNPHDLELSDDQLFSGSTTTRAPRSSSNTDDYATLLRMERERKERREQEFQGRKEEKKRDLQGKIDKYNQREQEVQEMLRKMIKK